EFITIGIGSTLKGFLVKLLGKTVFEVRHDAIDLGPAQGITIQIPFGMDYFPRLVIQALAAFDIQVAITQQTLVQGQHQHVAHQRPSNRGETGRRVLLENGHEKAEGSPLVALSAGNVETVLKIFSQLLVKAPLLVVHDKGFRMNPAAGGERGAAPAAGRPPWSADKH